MDSIEIEEGERKNIRRKVLSKQTYGDEMWTKGFERKSKRREPVDRFKLN